MSTRLNIKSRIGGYVVGGAIERGTRNAERGTENDMKLSEAIKQGFLKADGTQRVQLFGAYLKDDCACCAMGAAAIAVFGLDASLIVDGTALGLEEAFDENDTSCLRQLMGRLGLKSDRTAVKLIPCPVCNDCKPKMHSGSLRIIRDLTDVVIHLNDDHKMEWTEIVEVLEGIGQ